MKTQTTQSNIPKNGDPGTDLQRVHVQIQALEVLNPVIDSSLRHVAQGLQRWAAQAERDLLQGKPVDPLDFESEWLNVGQAYLSLTLAVSNWKEQVSRLAKIVNKQGRGERF